MKNIKKTSTILTAALMLSVSAAFAAEEGTAAKDTVEKKQLSLLEKLDSLNQAILGLRLMGTAKAGGLTSMASSDQFTESSGTQENQAYTHVNLKFLAQPSSETRINVQLTLHKDWQSAYEENNNPAIGHWFSYDGSILNKHVDFNLGYMRVGYTPLTIYTPQVQILQEPEIFTRNRMDAMEYRNLDTTSRRLMQGLNVVYNSGAVGPLDNIYAQATGTRMRNTAKKNDQVFFDFDWSDRYAYGLRAGTDAMGGHLGVNFVNIFDRRKSTRSRDITTSDTLIYDDNAVLSVEFGYDSKKLLPNLPVNFGLNGEFAMSWWDVDREYLSTVYEDITSTKEYTYPAGETSTSVVYVSSSVSKSTERVTEDYLEDNGGIAFNIQPYVEGSVSKLKFKVNAMYLQNDEKFWSDLASTSSYSGNSVILNSNALYENVDEDLISSFASGSLENLYFSVYNSNLLNATNLMTSGNANVMSENYSESSLMYNRLYNNFKLAHFYRNGYNANSLKKLEAAEALLLMDPSVNLALPYGLATPDRKGFAVSLDGDWDEAISFNLRFSQYDEEATDNKYTTIGVGLGVDIGMLTSLGRHILVQGSFEKASEDSYLERSSQRIVGGLTADIWGPIAFQAGIQTLTKKFEGNIGYVYAGLPVGTSFVEQVDEMLLLVGPKIRIAPESYITVRYGLLTNSVDYINSLGESTELSIDKSLVTAEVTVNF